MSETSPHVMSQAVGASTSRPRLEEAASLWHNALAPELRVPATAPDGELSDQRLRSLGLIAERLHQTIPEFVGMTVYGSTARGEAGPKSDADLFIFIEPSEAASSPQANPRIPADEPRIFRAEEKMQQSYLFHPAIDLDYKDVILKQLRAAAIPSADIDVMPMSEEIIDKSVATLLEAARTFEGDTDRLQLPRNVRGLFHKPVDADRLQPYIARVMADLAASEFGELAWALIRHRIVGFEQGRQPAAREFSAREIPKSLAEAQIFYGTTRP